MVHRTEICLEEADVQNAFLLRWSATQSLTSTSSSDLVRTLQERSYFCVSDREDCTAARIA